jgi:dephospho-CoA kinase
MLVIGLTGGIGSGKTTIANRFAQHHIPVIDADQIAHTLTQPGGIAIPIILQAFGPTFITQEQALDRAKMRDVVFRDKDARQHLESLLHPLILAEYDQAAHKAQGAYLVFVAPLLTELANWRSRVSRVLLVDCSKQTQIKRVMQRSGLSRQQVLAIIAQQATRAQRLAIAHDVIRNTIHTSIPQLYKEVDKWHQYYLALAEKAAKPSIPALPVDTTSALKYVDLEM